MRPMINVGRAIRAITDEDIRPLRDEYRDERGVLHQTLKGVGGKGDIEMIGHTEKPEPSWWERLTSAGLAWKPEEQSHMDVVKEAWNNPIVQAVGKLVGGQMVSDIKSEMKNAKSSGQMKKDIDYMNQKATDIADYPKKFYRDSGLKQLKRNVDWTAREKWEQFKGRKANPTFPSHKPVEVDDETFDWAAASQGAVDMKKLPGYMKFDKAGFDYGFDKPENPFEGEDMDPEDTFGREPDFMRDSLNRPWANFEMVEPSPDDWDPSGEEKVAPFQPRTVEDFSSEPRWSLYDYSQVDKLPKYRDSVEDYFGFPVPRDEDIPQSWRDKYAEPRGEKNKTRWFKGGTEVEPPSKKRRVEQGDVYETSRPIPKGKILPRRVITQRKSPVFTRSKARGRKPISKGRQLNEMLESEMHGTKPWFTYALDEQIAQAGRANYSGRTRF